MKTQLNPFPLESIWADPITAVFLLMLYILRIPKWDQITAFIGKYLSLEGLTTDVY